MIFMLGLLMAEFCLLARAEGSCQDSLLQWFYDKADGVCKQFVYTGCDGNENRFQTRQQCETHCSLSQGKSTEANPLGRYPSPSHARASFLADICNLPRVVGPCSGSFRQWYYDSGTDRCYEFDYGGCQGNPNRFNNGDDCERRCQKVRPIPTTTTVASATIYTLPPEETTTTATGEPGDDRSMPTFPFLYEKKK